MISSIHEDGVVAAATEEGPGRRSRGTGAAERPTTWGVFTKQLSEKRMVGLLGTPVSYNVSEGGSKSLASHAVARDAKNEDDYYYDAGSRASLLRKGTVLMPDEMLEKVDPFAHLFHRLSPVTFTSPHFCKLCDELILWGSTGFQCYGACEGFFCNNPTRQCHVKVLDTPCIKVR